MGLKYPGEWKFEGDGVGVPDSLRWEVAALVKKIANANDQPKWIVETFKTRFGRDSSSSSLDWAYSDLDSALSGIKNGAEFAEALWLAVEEVKAERVVTPSEKALNSMFEKHEFPYRYDGSQLTRIDLVEAHPGVSGPDDDQRMRYRVGTQIGQGGFGSVHRAVRSTAIADFEHAIKFLDPSPFIRDRERARERFKREVKAVQKLQHRGIVSYVDAGIDNQLRPYLVMPLIEGGDLKTAAGALPLLQRPWLMAQVLEAVTYAHGLNVLHRDLKPSNILLRASDRQPIIVDWGLSYLFDDTAGASLTTSAVGSLGYVPEEVLADPKLRTPGHDIYACGVILYEILGGSRPVLDSYGSLARVHPALSAVDPLVRKAISPASTRYPTASAFHGELCAVAANLYNQGS